jgi:hypothetical protein
MTNTYPMVQASWCSHDAAYQMRLSPADSREFHCRLCSDDLCRTSCSFNTTTTATTDANLSCERIPMRRRSGAVRGIICWAGHCNADLSPREGPSGIGCMEHGLLGGVLGKLFLGDKGPRRRRIPALAYLQPGLQMTFLRNTCLFMTRHQQRSVSWGSSSWAPVQGWKPSRHQ